MQSPLHMSSKTKKRRSSTDIITESDDSLSKQRKRRPSDVSDDIITSQFRSKDGDKDTGLKSEPEEGSIPLRNRSTSPPRRLVSPKGSTEPIGHGDETPPMPKRSVLGFGDEPITLSEKIQKLSETVSKLTSISEIEHHKDPALYKELSTLKREEDKHKTVTGRGGAKINELPKSEWWRFFIDAPLRRFGPMAFDNDKSPGFYYTMMKLFEDHLEGIAPSRPSDGTKEKQIAATKGISAIFMPFLRFFHTPTTKEPIAKLNAETYKKIHEQIAQTVLTKDSPGASGYGRVESKWSGIGVTYGVNPADDWPIDFEALKQLVEQGVITVKPDTFAVDDEAREKASAIMKTENKSGIIPQIIVYIGKNSGGIWSGKGSVRYPEEDAPDIANRLFERYYREVSKAADEWGKLKAVVRVVRDLHVSHFFEDGNGRLNISLLLNKFLMENGFPPAHLMVSPGVFGGGVREDDLVSIVKDGIAVSTALIQEVEEKGAPLPETEVELKINV